MRPGNGPGKSGQPGSSSGSDQTWRWAFAVVAIVVIVLIVSSGMFSRSSATTIKFSKFQQDVSSKLVHTANWDNATGVITGTLKDGGGSYTTTGPLTPTDPMIAALNKAGVDYTFSTPTSSALGEILIYRLPVAMIIGFFVWMSRRAQGQMSGIMSIGRSRAKVYTAERPRTTFDDVSGYQGV